MEKRDKERTEFLDSSSGAITVAAFVPSNSSKSSYSTSFTTLSLFLLSLILLVFCVWLIINLRKLFIFKHNLFINFPILF